MQLLLRMFTKFQFENKRVTQCRIFRENRGKESAKKVKNCLKDKDDGYIDEV